MLLFHEAISLIYIYISLSIKNQLLKICSFEVITLSIGQKHMFFLNPPYFGVNLRIFLLWAQVTLRVVNLLKVWLTISRSHNLIADKTVEKPSVSIALSSSLSHFLNLSIIHPFIQPQTS